jgi:hypothetical protein
LTPYTNQNPSFTVIEVDEEYLIPLNFKTYFFNLSKANSGEPQWELLHDFVDHYGIPNVSPNSLNELATMIQSSEDKAKLYLWNESRRASSMPETCDEACRKDIYCQLTTSE